MNKPLIGVSIILAVFVSGFFALSSTGLQDMLENASELKTFLISLGLWGPVLIILLMIFAIVMSPIPSAPIALASGAIYGHTWGSLYILTGSMLGAVIAFLIARLFGYDVLQRWFGGKLASSWVGSQNTLMATVFFSRLLPFISFDIVSYIAGFTSLQFWRFFIATLAGIAPASFLLGHFGSELSSAETFRVGIALIVVSLFVVVSVIFRIFAKGKDT